MIGDGGVVTVTIEVEVVTVGVMVGEKEKDEGFEIGVPVLVSTLLVVDEDGRL